MQIIEDSEDLQDFSPSQDSSVSESSLVELNLHQPLNHTYNSTTTNPPQRSLISTRQWVVNLPDVPLFSTHSVSQTNRSIDIHQTIEVLSSDAHDSNWEDPIALSFQQQELFLLSSISSQSKRSTLWKLESHTSIDNNFIELPLLLPSDGFSTNFDIK